MTAFNLKSFFPSVAVFLLALSCINGPDNSNTVTDIDGNVYKTVTYGTQEWTVENYRATKFNDGSAIPHLPEDDVWYIHFEPAYCFYGNMTHADSIKKYGALYNYWTIKTGKLAPEGWHVPTDSDWTVLHDYLISSGHNWDGTLTGNKIGKSLASTSGWVQDTCTGNVGNDLLKNNSSGFNAYPVGWRTGDHGYYGFGGTFAFFWSSTQASNPSDTINSYTRYVYARADSTWRGLHTYLCGLSVRLVKD
jgi:uncharacterized protein (TIGR02145 family)